MKKLIFLTTLSIFLFSCGNPLGSSDSTFIDQGHAPGVALTNPAASALGFEFNSLSHTYLATSGGRFKVSAAMSTTNKPTLVSSGGRFVVYSTVQGQFLSDEGAR